MALPDLFELCDLRRQQHLSSSTLSGSGAGVCMTPFYQVRMRLSIKLSIRKANKYADLQQSLRIKLASVAACTQGVANRCLQAASRAALASDARFPSVLRARRSDRVQGAWRTCADAVSAPPQHLDSVTLATAEDEDVAAERILKQRALHNRVSPPSCPGACRSRLPQATPEFPLQTRSCAQHLKHASQRVRVDRAMNPHLGIANPNIDKALALACGLCILGATWVLRSSVTGS